MDDARPLTYGEFPELFEGFPPDEPVDLDDRRTHSALFMRGDWEAMRRLYPPEWYEARRKRKAEEESVRLADVVRGPRRSQPDMAEPAAGE